MTAFGGALDDPTKIMGSRIAAYAVDLFLASFLVIVLAGLFDASQFHRVDVSSPREAQRICNLVTTRNTPGGSDQEFQSGDDVCFSWGSSYWYASPDEVAQTRVRLAVIGVVVGALNLVVLTTLTGASVGKLLFGLRVVRADGQRAGIGRNTIRWILLIVDAACCWLPGLLTSFNSQGHRRIGDMAAGTYVVHRSAEGKLLNIPGHIVVRRHDAYGGWGPAPVEPEPTLGEGGGIDAPVFDPSRNTYVRYDQASGVWFQWDDTANAWVPAKH